MVILIEEFILKTAQQAALEGRLEPWVIDYLKGPANNIAFAEGLKKEQRYWRGPLEVPLSKLTRVCGPEVDMPYRVKELEW